ncbi:hypothetical protein [Pseudoalteromonas tunicata]|uniref:Uncharacterized protein n=1 Tax=Pseudoalteromonas tunicata D2 TaxID=87626 RepID=A4C8W0_9GAMM|nr:hypothetical protein [Pseudoalteromonas tunicata]ATC93528.1 hypothetical protein PTUN_a0800 [Pseudoalteromonas tunicata]EAR29025.1 hypothetical protein PTD2_08274 [Pseudoalteromonas tunicata D2]MDP4983647.1 hypothetical protein [Pseudoalteromonas tunicata]MDP5211746.1 hypothetical protein [Pseudoalteromonas tunicata]
MIQPFFLLNILLIPVLSLLVTFFGVQVSRYVFAIYHRFER